jgi:hypothetical protein
MHSTEQVNNIKNENNNSNNSSNNDNEVIRNNNLQELNLNHQDYLAGCS